MLTGPTENKMRQPTSQVLRCACCGLPYARIVDGRLVVVSEHHGQKHANAIAIEELVGLVRQIK